MIQSDLILFEDNDGFFIEEVLYDKFGLGWYHTEKPNKKKIYSKLNGA